MSSFLSAECWLMLFETEVQHVRVFCSFLCLLCSGPCPRGSVAAWDFAGDGEHIWLVAKSLYEAAAPALDRFLTSRGVPGCLRLRIGCVLWLVFFFSPSSGLPCFLSGLRSGFWTPHSGPSLQRLRLFKCLKYVWTTLIKTGERQQ